MSPSNSKQLLAVIALGGLLAADGAWALKTDKNQPINVNSDHADFQTDAKNSSNGIGIYTGHVVITQGSIVINADKAVFHMVDNDLDIADITGNPATFVQQPDDGLPMHGQSLEITYDVPKSEIVLITDAKLTQQVLQAVGKGPNKTTAPGERLMTAQRIRYNTETQHVIAKAGDAEQRVHITFPPKTPAPVSATAPKPKTGAPGGTTKNHGAPAVFMPRSAATSAASAPAATTAPAPAGTTHAGPP